MRWRRIVLALAFHEELNWETNCCSGQRSQKPAIHQQQHLTQRMQNAADVAGILDAGEMLQQGRKAGSARRRLRRGGYGGHQVRLRIGELPRIKLAEMRCHQPSHEFTTLPYMRRRSLELRKILPLVDVVPHRDTPRSRGRNQTQVRRSVLLLISWACARSASQEGGELRGQPTDQSLEFIRLHRLPPVHPSARRVLPDPTANTNRANIIGRPTRASGPPT